jgi:hypothetical protein
MDVAELSVTAELLQRTESADGSQAKAAAAEAATAAAGADSLFQVPPSVIADITAAVACICVLLGWLSINHNTIHLICLSFFCVCSNPGCRN